MQEDFSDKLTVQQIRERFDADVERFSNLETGQAAAIDSPLNLELIAEAAKAVTPHATRLLDIGCGAGNYMLRLLMEFPEAHCTLVDLSKPMGDRALQRVTEAGALSVTFIQGDIREIDLGIDRFDVVVAGQCLHHLRGEEEWRDTFLRLRAALSAGGSLWIADSLAPDMPELDALFRLRWRRYLSGLRDEAYADHVLDYVDKEDTPRSLTWQLDLLRSVGFKRTAVLHKNNRFASFGAT